MWPGQFIGLIQKFWVPPSKGRGPYMFSPYFSRCPERW